MPIMSLFGKAKKTPSPSESTNQTATPSPEQGVNRPTLIRAKKERPDHLHNDIVMNDATDADYVQIEQLHPQESDARTDPEDTPILKEKGLVVLDRPVNDKDHVLPLESTYRVLTSKDARFAVPESFQFHVCLLDDGRLFVSESAKHNTNVRQFISRLEKNNFEHRIVYTSISVVQSLYKNAIKEISSTTEQDSEMQKLAKRIFADAVYKKSSDIHIRVDRIYQTQIYYRINSDLTLQEEHPYEVGVMLCTAIYQSMASVSDRSYEIGSRQDARISGKDKLPKGLDGIRIATGPTADGNIMVLRLLYNAAVTSLDLGLLGYLPQQTAIIERAKKRPIGLNVIAGPTGSGKSTTLQRTLMSIIEASKGRKHIITVEDPPEYPIIGAVQTPVSNANTPEERTLAFQSAIKSCMRSDPDILMVGETRDPASALLVIEASMTGHQVWTTVHANTAMSIPDRFLTMELPVEDITDSETISSFTCQRLLQTLCDHCKVPLVEKHREFTDEELDRWSRVGSLQNMYIRGKGCSHCNGMGTTGRTVVAETVIPDHEMMTYLRDRNKHDAIAYWRTRMDGIQMHDHAGFHVSQGISDPRDAEVLVNFFPPDIKNLSIPTDE